VDVDVMTPRTASMTSPDFRVLVVVVVVVAILASAGIPYKTRDVVLETTPFVIKQ
jgi:hypothetical protein